MKEVLKNNISDYRTYSAHLEVEILLIHSNFYSMSFSVINSFLELKNAILSRKKEIKIVENIICLHSVILTDGTKIYGEKNKNIILKFIHDDGIGLTSNNEVSNLYIQVIDGYRAFYTTIIKNDLGTFLFSDLKIQGSFKFIVEKGVIKTRIKIDKLDLDSSDRSKGFLRIHNLNSNSNSNIYLEAKNIKIGQSYLPFFKPYIEISGAGDNGGWVIISKLHIIDVYPKDKISSEIGVNINYGIRLVNGVVLLKPLAVSINSYFF